LKRGELAAAEGATVLTLTAMELIFSPARRADIVKEFHEKE
jgi:hypothetical protein